MGARCPYTLGCLFAGKGLQKPVKGPNRNIIPVTDGGHTQAALNFQVEVSPRPGHTSSPQCYLRFRAENTEVGLPWTLLSCVEQALCLERFPAGNQVWVFLVRKTWI